MLPKMDGTASREALHAVLVHLRTLHLKTHGLVMEKCSIVSWWKKRNLLQLSSIEHVQRTIRKKLRPSLTRVLSHLFPPSPAHVQLSTSISTATSAKCAFLQENQLCERSISFHDAYGKAAKRQHSAGLKNTEQETPKRKETTVPSC